MKDRLPALPPEGPHWFCVRTKRFTERSCAASLCAEFGIDVFCPMISFEKARRTTKAWVTEALFPNYLFAYFDFATQYRRVKTIRGVLKIVGFGNVAHPVPEPIISELKKSFSSEESLVIPSNIAPGEEVNVLSGPFRGLQALVTRVMPAKERVAILLDLLGGEREVEISSNLVIPEIRHPIIGK